MSAPFDGKSYTITLELRPEYLYAYVKGEADSYEITVGYWSEIAQACAENNVKRLLVDEDLAEQTVSMSDVYQGAADLSSMGLNGVKIAFFDRHADHHDLNQFGELVATNRGLFCKVFNDFDEAERWLLSD